MQAKVLYWTAVSLLFFLLPYLVQCRVEIPNQGEVSRDSESSKTEQSDSINDVRILVEQSPIPESVKEASASIPEVEEEEETEDLDIEPETSPVNDTKVEPIIKESPSPVMERSPEVVKESPPVMERSPEVVKESPPVMERSPEVVKESPPVMERSPLVVVRRRKRHPKDAHDDDPSVERRYAFADETADSEIITNSESSTNTGVLSTSASESNGSSSKDNSSSGLIVGVLFAVLTVFVVGGFVGYKTWQRIQLNRYRGWRPYDVEMIELESHW
eukprot:g2534.t1